MLSLVVDKVNKIELSELHTSLLTFYDHKVNPIVDKDTKNVGVDQAPNITGVDEETDE